MGIRGLMTFMYQNYNSCLKEHELSDCYLVMDGSNISNRLHQKLESHGAFGGDYDEYFSIIKDFMLELKKCNVSPIVLLDGVSEKTKLRTRLSRRQGNLRTLNVFNRGFSERPYRPLLLTEVFLDVVRDMGIACAQCAFEADQEIVEVAKIFNCPVLSADSDCFIMDAMFIPLQELYPFTRVKNSSGSKDCIKCLVYNVDDFLKATGLDKPLLYVFAMLLGNDIIENDVFAEFFSRIDVPQTDINGPDLFFRLIQWLKDKNADSALNDICSGLSAKNAGEVRKLFGIIKTTYGTSFISKSVSDELNKVVKAMPYSKPSIRHLAVDWPSEIAALYSRGVIPNFLLGMILHQMYLTSLQVEDLNDQSSHLRFLNLIRIVYSMLRPYLKTNKPLEMYVSVKRRYRLLPIFANPLKPINLGAVLKQPWEERIKLLCDLIGVPVNDLKFVPFNSWALFMLSCTCWVKEFKNSLSQAHIRAFVIMIIANQIVQTKVGYYSNREEFVRDWGDAIEKSKDVKITLERSSDFKEMLSNVKLEECLEVQKALMPLRRTTDLAVLKYDIKTVHLYNSFQTSLLYVMIINALLNMPLPSLRVEDFYSGTLLFNLYLRIKLKPSIEEFGSDLFERTPNLNQIYKFLSVKFSNILQKAASGNNKDFYF